MISYEQSKDGWRFKLADPQGDFAITSDPFATKAKARKGFEAMIKLLPVALPNMATPPEPDPVDDEVEE